MASLPSISPYFGLTSRWVETRGGERIHYHDEGAGAPLLFVHGSAVGVSAAANWWLNFPVLSRHFRCVAPDLIGYGLTEAAPDEDWGLDSWRDQIVRFADALGLDRFVLIGNSLGGRVSLEVARAHQDRVAGLITMGTVGLAPPTPPPPRPVGEPWRSEEVRRSMAHMVYDPSLATDELIDTRLALVNAPGGAEKFFRASEARNRTTAAAKLTADMLTDFAVPTLLIHGREDRIIPMASSVELVGALPLADLHVFSRCGHWAQIERLDDFNALALNFANKAFQTKD